MAKPAGSHRFTRSVFEPKPEQVAEEGRVGGSVSVVLLCLQSGKVRFASY